MRQDTDNYAQLFLNDTPLIDTRAPLEFNKGAFPHAHSLPLMTDSERAKVGTCYKKQGQQAAIELGHQLVRGKTKQQRMDAWQAFVQANPQGYLYCFRGGLRSQTVQRWLAEVGAHYPRVIGGYKAMRQFLLQLLAHQEHNGQFIILAGRTGCGKTHLLLEARHHIDLEGLANHRGSAFGKRVSGQPSQIDFENALAIAMLKHQHHYPDTPLLLEDESHLIGRCALPDPVRHRMRQSPLVLVETTLAERVEISYQDYILSNLQDARSLLGEEDGFNQFAEGLRQAMFKIRRRLGGAFYQQLSDQLNDALLAHQGGAPTGHKRWIEALLAYYYDPMYDYQLEKKSGRVLFRGNREEVMQWISHAERLKTP